MSPTKPATTLAWVLTSLAVAAPTTSPAQETPQYRVVRTVQLGAPSHWDYVVFDPGSARVFVAHGDEVTVVNGDSGEIVGHVKGLSGGTHGIALVHDANRGYTDEGKTGRAVSFNLKTLAVEKRNEAAEDADAVAFDPVSHHVFIINGDTGSITVIDPNTDSVIASIEVGGKLEYAVPGENAQLFVNGAGKREVVSVDTATNHITARWPVPDCESPHGLAMDPAAHRLFVSCLNKVLTVLNSQNGHIVTQLPIDSGSDAVVFYAKRNLIFSSNGRDGTISVIQQRNPNSYVALPPITTFQSARTMSLNPDTGRIYLVGGDSPGTVKLLFLDPVR